MVYLTTFNHYPQIFSSVDTQVFITKNDRFLKCGRNSRYTVKMLHLGSLKFISVADETFRFFFKVDYNL